MITESEKQILMGFIIAEKPVSTNPHQQRRMNIVTYKNPVCRGSWAFGNNCGKCERCIETKPKIEPHAQEHINDVLALSDRIRELEKQLTGVRSRYADYAKCKRDEVKLLEKQLTEVKSEYANFVRRTVDDDNRLEKQLFEQQEEAYNKEEDLLCKVEDLQAKLAESAPKLSYQQAKKAIKLFEGEYLGQDQERLWGWACNFVLTPTSKG